MPSDRSSAPEGLAAPFHSRVTLDVTVDAELGLARGIERDLVFEPAATRDAGRERRIRVWRERYLPADDAYLRAVDPAARADAVVDNRDPDAPRLRLRGSPTHGEGSA